MIGSKQGLGAMLVGALGFMAASAAAQGPVAADMQAVLNAKASTGGDLQAAARKMVQARGAAGEAVDVKTESYAADPGEQLKVFVPRASEHGKRPPMVVFFHDDWTSGTLEEGDLAALSLARRLNAVVISVDTRKAPAHPFPAQQADAFYAWDWAIKHADEWRVDRHMTAVAGAGTGATLALGVAARSQVAPSRKPAATLLIDPPADAALPQSVGGSPLDLRGLKPVVILNAGSGSTLEAGAKVEAALKAEGVRVERQVAPGVTPGFFGMGGVVRGAYDGEAWAAGRLRQLFGILYEGEPGTFTRQRRD